MKLTPNAAMRARDVSRPRAEHLAEAEAAEAGPPGSSRERKASGNAAKGNPGREGPSREGPSREGPSREGPEREGPGPGGAGTGGPQVPLRRPELLRTNFCGPGSSRGRQGGQFAGLLVVGDHGQAPGVTRLAGEGGGDEDPGEADRRLDGVHPL